MEKKKATTIGFAAIILWSTMVGLIRGVSEGLGPVGGAAMIYSLSGLLLIFTVGFPNLRQIPRRYLLAGSVLARPVAGARIFLRSTTLPGASARSA